VRTPLRILIVEDLPSDVELVMHEINKSGIEFTSRVVDEEQPYLEALDDFQPDIVLSDYSMPLFDGMAALRLCQKHAEGTPFIMVTGSMNEETAVECMKAGASDYVIKEHLRRIGPAIRTAIEKKLLEKEKARAEEALKVSEDKYRRLHHSMMDAFVSVDMEGHIQDWNESYLNMLGYSSKEIRTLTYKDITPEKWHAFEQSIVEQQIIPKGYSEIYEKEYQNKDGTIFPVEMRTFLLRDKTGKPSGMWAIVRDISERKRADEAIRASEEKYRQLVENANESIFVSQDAMIKFCNPKTLELLEYSREEILIKPFIHFIHPEDRDMVLERHQRRIRGEVVLSVYSFRIIDKKGSTKWVEVNAVLITWEGRPATLNFLTDITERKHAETALRNQMDFLETLVDTIPTPVFYKDRDGVYLGCNEQYAAVIIGLPKEEIIGHTILDLTEGIPTDLAQRYHDNDMDLIHIPGFRFYEEDRPCADGTTRSFVYSKATFTDIKGAVAGMVGIMMDISQRKLMEQELKESEHGLAIRSRISEIFLNFSGNELNVELLNAILDISRSTYGLFGYLDVDKNIIVPALTSEVWKDCLMPEKTFIFSWERICNSIFGRTVTGKSLIKTNLKGNVPEGHVAIENILTVPLLFQNTVIGLFAVANKASGYGEQEERVLKDIAEYIAPIMQSRMQQEREEQRRMESEEIQHSQLLFLQQLIDAIPTPVFYKDLQGIYLGCNRAFENFMGMTKEQVMGKTVYDLAPRDKADIYQDADMKLFENSGVQIYETSVTHTDGSARDVIFNKATYVGKDDKIAGIVGIMMDITDRKRSDELILRQGKVLDQSLDGIAITDLEGTLQYVNPAWAAMHGFAADELLGANLDLFHTSEQKGMEMASHLTLFKKEVFHTKDIEHLRKDGSVFPTLVSMFTLKDIQGTPTNIVAFIRDITEEQRIENLLRQAQKMEAVGQLAGGIAHDFNNMLSPILGYSDLLLTEMNPEDPRYHDILQIKQAGERAKDLTWQLLAFSRKQVMEMKQIDLRDVITDLQKILRRTIREDIVIRVILSPTPNLIYVDVGKIGQILMNLAINAQDAMPNGGTITIETSEAVLDDAYTETHPETIPGIYAMLAFSDTGSGMDRLTIEHIFEPFFTTKDPGKGTGLGLATIYGIVKQHNGHIVVYSEPGVGTTFKVYLPKLQENVDETKTDAEGSKEIKRGTETILVVEDEEAVRELICRILRKHGYTVISAESANECFQVIEHHKGTIDLLLTDVIMPGMNGKQLFDSITAEIPAMKVIFLSGYTYDVIAKHGMLTQGTYLITKPFTVSELMGKIRAVLDS
jgi:PAS domain S-box-containing protein